MPVYNVHMYVLPRVSDDGEVLPTAASRMEEFSELHAAKEHAEKHKGEFERIVVMQIEGDQQILVERYTNGEHILPEAKQDQGDGGGKQEPGATSEPSTVESAE